MELDIQKCSSRHRTPCGHLTSFPELRFRGPGGQGQTQQRITFVAAECEDVTCPLAWRHTSASTAGCLHLTSGAAPPASSTVQMGGSLPGTPLAHHRGEERQTHTMQLLLCPLCPAPAEGKNMLREIHLQKQQFLPTPWSPCLAPVSSQRGVPDSRMDFTW